MTMDETTNTQEQPVETTATETPTTPDTDMPAADAPATEDTGEGQDVPSEGSEEATA